MDDRELLDAFRLAARRRLGIDFNSTNVRVYRGTGAGLYPVDVPHDGTEDGALSAVRTAIIDAAAEIGRTM